MNQKYEVRYLPLFEFDLQAARDYIAFNLRNLQAALQLIDETEKAIQKRLSAPTSYEPFRSNRNRKHAYYRIHVRNYLVFYVVIDHIMEVRRFLHSRQDVKNLL